MDKKCANIKLLVPFSLLLLSLASCAPMENSYNNGYPNGWTRSQYGYDVVGVTATPYYYNGFYSSYNHYPSFYVSPWAYGSYHTYYPNNAFTSVYHAPYTIYPNYSPFVGYKVYNAPVITPYHYGGYYQSYHH